MSDGLALSALDWWSEAGVDTIVGDLPHDWLAPARPAAPAATVVTAHAAPRLPEDLASFRRWLLTDAPIPGPPAARLDAAGDAASGTMVVVDLPEAGDRAAGMLLSGEAGALFDRMLAAMTLDRGTIYLVPLSPARPATGRVSEADRTLLAPLLRHHVALARPRRVLLLGDAPACALLGTPLAQARGAARTVPTVAGPIPTIVSFHPRFVLDRPDYRKAAWADLQLFMAL